MLTDIRITQLMERLRFAGKAISNMRLHINNPHKALFGKPELAVYLAEVKEAVANLEDALNTVQVEQEEVLNILRKSELPKPVKPIPPRGRIIRENSDKPLCECSQFVARGVAHKCPQISIESSTYRKLLISLIIDSLLFY